MTHFSGTQSIDLCCESVDRFLFKWVVGVGWVGSLLRFAKHFAEEALGSLDSNETGNQLDGLFYISIDWYYVIGQLALKKK